MRDCEAFREALSAYADGISDGVDKEALEAHLEQCPQCKERLKALRTLHTELSRLDEEIPDGLHDRILRAVEEERSRPVQKPVRLAFRRCAAAAAIAVAVLGLGALGWSAGRDMNRTKSADFAAAEQNPESGVNAEYYNGEETAAETTAEVRVTATMPEDVLRMLLNESLTENPSIGQAAPIVSERFWAYVTVRADAVDEAALPKEAEIRDHTAVYRCDSPEDEGLRGMLRAISGGDYRLDTDEGGQGILITVSTDEN